MFLFNFSISISAEQYPLAILSCGGGGTHYTAECLRRGGFPMGHEIIDKNGYVGWPFVGGFYNCRGVPIRGGSFQHIFHQVRNPLKVITTWMKDPKGIDLVWAYIVKICPEFLMTDTYIVKCAKYWFYWNLLAEDQSEWRYQIESFMEILPEFESRVGIKLDQNNIQLIPKNRGAWQGTKKNRSCNLETP